MPLIFDPFRRAAERKRMKSVGLGLGLYHAGVVLLDLMMPAVTGWDVIETLRREGRLEQVPIAICTSSPASAPDGFPVVPKPVDFDQMLTVIRQLAR